MGSRIGAACHLQFPPVILLLEKQERKEVEGDDDSFLWIEGSQAGEESDFGFSPLFGASQQTWNK